jgi:hypothetical protein
MVGWMAEEIWFDSQPRQEMFLFFTASSSALEPTQPLIHWILGILFPVIKQ